MNRFLDSRAGIFFLWLVTFAVIAYLFNVPHLADGGLVLSLVAARTALKVGRYREPLQPFYNVAASSTAQCEIPRYQRTVLNILLRLSGTTLGKSDISRIEIFCGSKSIWGPLSGTELDDITRWLDGAAGLDANYLLIDFTYKNVKELGGEMVGGLDLTNLDDGKIRVEVQIGSGASSPALDGVITWGQPQGNSPVAGLMRKLYKRTFPQFASGDNFPGIDVGGAIICREFMRYTVANSGVSSANGQGASFANTGNGAMGTITVSAGTRCGRYKLRITAGATNAGAFVVCDPDGREIGGGNVAAAFAGGGLSFTLADGATDFVAGDGFNIDVLPLTSDGNLSNVEIKKNGDVVWSRTSRLAMEEQYRYGRFPITQMYVADFLVDGHVDAALDTQDATVLAHKINFTSADTLSVIFDVLAPPIAS